MTLLFPKNLVPGALVRAASAPHAKIGFSDSLHVNETIAIVGTGRMASVLATSLASVGFPPSVIAGRDLAAAEDLAGRCGAHHWVTIQKVPEWAKHVLVAVSDDAIEIVLPMLRGVHVVLHTSGATGYLPYSGIDACGVLHPLQTVADGGAALSGAMFAFGGDARAEEWALQLISRFGGRPLRVGAGKWAQYHAAAVMASNYQATLLDAAVELMQLAGVSQGEALRSLEPLTRASIDNIFRKGTAAALTGPVQRGDRGTVERHLAALCEATAATRHLYIAAALRTLPFSAVSDQMKTSLQEVLEAASA